MKPGALWLGLTFMTIMSFFPTGDPLRESIASTCRAPALCGLATQLVREKSPRIPVTDFRPTQALLMRGKDPTHVPPSASLPMPSPCVSAFVTTALVASLCMHANGHRAANNASCPSSCDGWLGDGLCDPGCDTKSCEYDLGDCAPESVPKVVYLHIRKTGGTSLHKYFALLTASLGGKVCRVFSWKSSIFTCGYFNAAAARAAAALRKLDHSRDTLAESAPLGMNVCQMWQRPQRADGTSVCQGCADAVAEAGCTYVELHHWDASVASSMQERGFKVVTMLREPEHQLESSYNFEAFERYGAEGRIPPYAPDLAGFEAWTRDRLGVGGFDSLRMLSSCWSEHSTDNDTATAPSSGIWAPEACAVHPTYFAPAAKEGLARRTNPVLLDRALRALHRVDFIGITERFEETVDLLERSLLGVRTGPIRCPMCARIRSGEMKENVQTQGHRFRFTQFRDRTLRAKLRESMAPDLVLYHTAAALFQQRLEQANATPSP